MVMIIEKMMPSNYYSKGLAAAQADQVFLYPPSSLSSLSLSLFLSLPALLPLSLPLPLLPIFLSLSLFFLSFSLSLSLSLPPSIQLCATISILIGCG